MKKFYRMTGVAAAHLRELRVAAAEAGISQAEAFSRLALSADMAEVITFDSTSFDPRAKTAALEIDVHAKAAIDDAAARSGVLVQSVGRMVLAAHAGRMAEALRESAA